MNISNTESNLQEHQLDTSDEYLSDDNNSRTDSSDLYVDPPNTERALSDEMVISLLSLAPTPSSKETKALLSKIKTFSVPLIYDKILQMKKYNNSELLHYLSIMNRCLYYPINATKLINLKFASHDKYTVSLSYEFFSIVDKIYDKLTFENKLLVFSRYIYLFKNKIAINHSIYILFKNILKKDFLDCFLCKQFYAGFPFLKEFIVDFMQVGTGLVKIGYENVHVRELVYHTLNHHYKNGPPKTHWLVQRWNCSSNLTISEMFYFFDCVYFMEDLALKRFEVVGDVLDCILKELGNVKECFFCNKIGTESFDNIHQDTKLQEEIQVGFASINAKATSDNISLSCNSNSLTCNNLVNDNLLENNNLQNTSLDNNNSLADNNNLQYKSLQNNNNLQNSINPSYKSLQNRNNLQNSNIPSYDTLDNYLDSIKHEKRMQLIKSKIDSKHQFRNIISIFNKTKQLPDNFHVKYLRISPITDLKSLGEFICKEKNIKYLREFTESFDFHKMDILESLRIFLGSFHLVGESQIIERVIGTFSEEYVKQNVHLHSSYNNSLLEYYKNLVYSFVVMNTMLHNKSIEKKPTFEEYLRLMDYERNNIIDKDTLKVYFTSIKENEMKLPVSWFDSYDKYLLSLSLEDSWKELPSYDCKNIPDNSIVFDTNTLNYKTSNKQSSMLCDDCVILAYRHLFISSFRNYLFLEPDIFFKICKLLNIKEIYEEFLKLSKNNLSKHLLAFKLYFEYFTVEDTLYVKEVLNSISKMQKQKSQAFFDIKSLFSTSKVDISNVNLTDKIIGSVLQPFVQQISSFLLLKFQNDDVCNHNLKIVFELLESESKLIENQDRKSNERTAVKFIDDIFTQVVLNNTSYIKDISIFKEDLKFKIVEKEPGLIGCLKSDEKIKYLLNKKNLDGNDYRTFIESNTNDENSFKIFCRLQHEFGGFNEAVKIVKNGEFTFWEKYKESLGDTGNVLKLFNTSNTVLNLKITMNIHKNGCPLEDKVFLDFDKIAYLIWKCENNDSVLINRLSEILVYLSDSLILLLKLYLHIIPLLQKVSGRINSILLGTLTKRLKIYQNTGTACCRQFEIRREALAGISVNSHSYVLDSLNKLINEGLVPVDTLKFIQNTDSKIVEL